MSRTLEITAFRRLRAELKTFADEHVGCGIDHESEKAVLLLIGDSYLEAGIGNFEMVLSSGLGLNFERLRNEHDVNRALAICDAVVAGRGVSVQGPDGYPTRSWIFVDSRGLRETVTSTAVSFWSCRRARSIPLSHWRRQTLPVLFAKAA